MADLSRIDIRKINANGRYVDLANDTIIDLSDEQIQALRKYYNNPMIASNRHIRDYQDVRRDQVRRQERRTNTRPSYRVTRDQKYNKGNYRTKKKIHSNRVGKLIIVGSLVVCVVLGGKLINIGQAIDNPLEIELMTKSSVDVATNFVSNRESNSDNDEMVVDSIIDEGNDLLDTGELVEVSEELSNRQLMIQNICNIYQVNYDKVYSCLAGLTNDFTSQEYLEGVIPGVTCKGVQVNASTEEELLVYAIRCIKQVPESLGLSSDNLYINNGYVSGVNYNEQISRVADILGVDRCLLYAIVQSECGFDSDLFNNKNNPAGIKAPDGSWWVFDTKEEGFFELGMEVLKYYRKIGITPDNIDYDTLSKIRDIHAPLSDGNEHWLPNVTSNLEYAKLHEAEMFNSLEQNNGLLR